MLQLVFVAAGGALGALARFGVSSYMVKHVQHSLPLGTLLVNVLGALIMGVLFVVIMEKAQIAAEWRPLLMVGFLGSFTTFSTFSLEVLVLFENGHIMSAAIYILLSVILSILALTCAVWLTRLLLV